MNKGQLHEPLYQALEMEMGGVEIYETAVSLAQNANLREGWQEYLEQTRRHVEILTTAFGRLGLLKTAIAPRARGRRGPSCSRAA